MRFFFVAFLVLFFCKSTAAQSAQLRQYYRLINRAELSIVAQRLDSALLYYQKALDLNKQAFGKDLYNAILVACRQGHDAAAYQFSRRLAGLGYPITNLQKDSAGRAFWQGPYKNRLAQLAARPTINYDLGYRRIIEKMVQNDQYFRQKPNAYQLYDDTIRKIDRVNVFKLQKLIAQKGFPSEYKVGIEPDDLLSPLHEILFLHQSAGPYQIINFSREVKQAILDGNIENNAGSNLIGRMDGYYRYSTSGFYMADFDTVSSITGRDTTWATDWGYIQPDAKKERELDSLRGELMLEPLAERYIKEVFFMKNRTFLINANGYKSIWHSKEYNQFKYIQDHLVPLKSLWP
jgi:hypothetical protein